MLHHVSFGVADLARSAAFYDAVLSPLGYVRVWTDATAIGYGHTANEDKFAIKLQEDARSAGPGFHLAFAATTRAAVDEFHAAAIRSGGTSNGPPGLRPAYGANYYAAFVIDPDGYRVEAVIVTKG